jgi:hypothetical protein
VIADQIGSIWVDPVCGNGLCEQPKEQPAYGHPDNRFGCEEDCGVEDNVSNLTLVLDYQRPALGAAPPLCTAPPSVPNRARRRVVA